MNGKLVITENKNTTHLSGVDNKYYYAVKFNFIGDKIQYGFITQNLNDEFFVMYAVGVTFGSRFYGYNYKALIQLIDELIKEGHQVYQFDNYKQLFEELAKI